MPGKEKMQFEYLIKTSSKILYNCISTPGGLAEWFCDDVNIKNDVYSFQWDGAIEQAKLKGKKAGEYMRFQWLDDEGEDYFFELRIKIDALTKEVALIVTDFAEPDEVEEAKLLWENQISDLKHILGS